MGFTGLKPRCQQGQLPAEAGRRNAFPCLLELHSLAHGTFLRLSVLHLHITVSSDSHGISLCLPFIRTHLGPAQAIQDNQSAHLQILYFITSAKSVTIEVTCTCSRDMGGAVIQPTTPGFLWRGRQDRKPSVHTVLTAWRPSSYPRTQALCPPSHPGQAQLLHVTAKERRAP